MKGELPPNDGRVENIQNIFDHRDQKYQNGFFGYL